MFLGVQLPETFWVGVIASLIYGPMGIIFLLLGFKLFDWVLPKVDFQERMNANPMAAAAIVSAFFIGLSYIVGSVVH